MKGVSERGGVAEGHPIFFDLAVLPVGCEAMARVLPEAMSCTTPEAVFGSTPRAMPQSVCSAMPRAVFHVCLNISAS